MKKNTSKIKRIGIKSIHYNKNKIIAENSFSKETSLLFNAEYDDIEKLLNVINYNEYENNFVEFTNIKNDSGFTLSKKYKKHNLESLIRKVKTKSFAQEKLNISNENNIEIQIYQNYEDLRRIIANYCNHIIFSLNAISKEDREATLKTFDEIGTIPTFVTFDEYSDNNEEKKNRFYNVLFPAMKNALIKFGLLDKHINYLECILYARSIIKDFQNYKPKLSKILQNAVKNIIDEKRNQVETFLQNPVKNYLKDEKNLTDIENILKDSDTFYSYGFNKNFKKKYESKLNKKLKNNDLMKEIFNKEILSKNEHEVLFDYLKLISIIRQFSVHNKLDISDYNCYKYSNLNFIALQDVKKYENSFAKNNSKYLSILSELYNDENIFDEFFEYITYDSNKNLGISIEKIRKQITELQDYGKNVESTILSEFLNKFRILLNFILFKHFKDSKILQETIIKLKECSNDEEKDDVYLTLASDFIEAKESEINKLKNIVLNNVGKITPKVKNHQFKLKQNNKNEFFNLLYVFSKFLTKKEANDFYAQLINKCESISELFTIARISNIDINLDTFKSYNNFINVRNDFKEQIKYLQLLRSLRLKDSIEKTDINNSELKKIFDAFDTQGYSYDNFNTALQKNENNIVVKSSKNREVKPLKQFLRNEVFVSKQFQYLSNYSNTSICIKIAKQKNIVNFVLYNMLGLNPNEEIPNKFSVKKEKESMHKYLSRIYQDFKNSGLTINSDNYLIKKSELNELVNEICNLSFKKLSDSIFGNTNFNYKSIVSLYFNVCYQVVKNLMAINSSYLIQIQDYENLYKNINNINDVSPIDNPEQHVLFNLSVLKDYLEFSPNENARSYKQIKSLLEKDYIKYVITDNNLNCTNNYLNLIRLYRNRITHCSILADDSIFDNQIENVTSYFALYQILIQKQLKDVAKKCYGNNFDEFFRLDENKSYSTKLCIAMNFPYAYNISRFNNNTIEKYFNKNK